jgi:hypothetical protein
MSATTCGKALEILVRLKNPIGIAKTNKLFGRIYWKSGETNTADAFFEESMKLYAEFSIPLGLANCCQEYAQFLEETKDSETAAEFYNKAEEIFRKLDLEQYGLNSNTQAKNVKDVDEIKQRHKGVMLEDKI